MKIDLNLARAREVVGNSLGPRQWALFLATIRLETAEDTAARLNLRVHNVQAQRGVMIRNIGVRNPAELVAWAIGHGIIIVSDPPPPVNRGKRIRLDVRVEIDRMRADGRSVKEIAGALSIPQATLYRYLRKPRQI